MKNLGRILIALIVFSFATESFAQVKVGGKTGLNISTMVYKDNDETYSDDFDKKLGFHLGPIVEFSFTELISLETGLILSSKGFKRIEKDEYEEWKQTLNTLYLDIPITAKFSFNLGGVKIYTALGPYIGIGLTGKVKEEYTYYDEDPEKDDWEIKWGSDEEKHDLKRLDIGLSGGAGVQIKFILIGFHYNLGLANISPYTENGATVANRTFGFSVGVLFGGGGSGDNDRE